MLTRTERTKQIRKLIDKQWNERFFKFIRDNPDKPWDWRGISEQI
jgi:hypothetical protein